MFKIDDENSFIGIMFYQSLPWQSLNPINDGSKSTGCFLFPE